MHYFVSTLVCNHLEDEDEDKAGCFAHYHGAVGYGAVGWSAVCDCGIF